MAVSTLLQRRGFELILATGVKNAIEEGLAHEFDLLIADIGLEDGTGDEILHELRRVKNFPAIALTVYGMQSEIETQKAEGFDQCVTKPFDLKKLEGIIEGLLLNYNVQL